MCIFDSHIHKSPEINSLNQVLTSLKGLSQSLNQVATPIKTLLLYFVRLDFDDSDDPVLSASDFIQ